MKSAPTCYRIEEDRKRTKRKRKKKIKTDNHKQTWHGPPLGQEVQLYTSKRFAELKLELKQTTFAADPQGKDPPLAHPLTSPSSVEEKKSKRGQP